MSGRKQFDETEVIDAAMMEFWRGGYEATSVTALETATGLNKSSLYNAFVSKEELFIRCLERYMKLYGEALVLELEHPDFRQAIEGFFNRMLNRFSDKSLPQGCLATFAAMEADGIGEAVTGQVYRRQCRGNAAWICKALQACGHRRNSARGSGRSAATIDCETLAALLTSIARGIAVLDQSGRSGKMTKPAVDGALSMIDGMMRQRTGPIELTLQYRQGDSWMSLSPKGQMLARCMNAVPVFRHGEVSAR